MLNTQASTSRRAILGAGALGVICAATGRALAAPPPVNPAAAAPDPPAAPKKKIDKGPPLAPDLVKSFVGAAHSALDKVKAMLAEPPRLINATWDWGGGDWETALGGASHMGRPDIASHL